MTLLTPVPEDQAVSLCPGELILDRDFRERRIEIGSEPSGEAHRRRRGLSHPVLLD
jgi:hypothetical protein